MRGSVLILAFLLVLLAASAAAETSGDAGATVDDSTRFEQDLGSYTTVRNVWRFASIFLRLAIVALILWSGWAARMQAWSHRLPTAFLATWAMAALFLIANCLLYLPFAFLRGFLIEAHFGLTNQSVLQWLGRGLIGLAVTCAIAVVPASLYRWAVLRFRRWWLVLSGLMVPAIVAGVVLAPVFVSPLYHDFQPLTDAEVESDVRSLVRQAGIGGAEILEVDASSQSRRLNAYVTGLLGSERIVLYDTMIATLTRNELRHVMAHEIGHYVKHHVWLGTGVAVLFIGLCLWIVSLLAPRLIARFGRRWGFTSMSERAALPLIYGLLIALQFGLAPLYNVPSRAMERAADRYAMELAGTPRQDAISCFEKLSRHNLANPSPHPLIEFWFYSHPSLERRIAAVSENANPLTVPESTL